MLQLGGLSGVGDRVEWISSVNREHWVFWGLPIALTVVAVLLLPLTPSVVYWVIGLIAMGIALGFSLAGIYYTVDPFQPGYRRARLGLNALTYAAALVLFLVVYRTRVRSIVSATEVMLVSGLLALELSAGQRTTHRSGGALRWHHRAGARSGNVGVELLASG